MKIIATTRTRNEAANVERFCDAYKWADQVLIADGGSQDNTVKLANRFKNVIVKDFHERAYPNEEDKSIWINPHGKQINFLIDWAKDEGADWIIFDDCDCVPSYAMRDNGRKIFKYAEENSKQAIFAYRIYMYLEDQYFPKMNEPGQSIWAWHKDLDIRAEESEFRHNILGIPDMNSWRGYPLEIPVALLHRSWPGEEEIQRKITFYGQVYPDKKTLHPLQFAGPPAPLPEWAREAE